MRMRRTTPTLLALGIAAPFAFVGCSVSELLPVPDCVEGGSAIIAAQSVPSATYVPCLNALPTGWEVASVTVDQDGTTVHLDSDRAGTGAAVLRYEERCELEDAITAPDDQPGADRYDDIERLEPGFRARRLYVFEGGCVWWQFDFDDGAPAALSIELGNTLELVSRDDVAANLRDTFIDEDL
jgi:hypothetical protein